MEYKLRSWWIPVRPKTSSDGKGKNVALWYSHDRENTASSLREKYQKSKRASPMYSIAKCVLLSSGSFHSETRQPLSSVDIACLQERPWGDPVIYSCWEIKVGDIVHFGGWPCRICMMHCVALSTKARRYSWLCSNPSSTALRHRITKIHWELRKLHYWSDQYAVYIFSGILLSVFWKPL